MKTTFAIARVSKDECKEILDKYHYLSCISKGFKSGFNYGLFNKGILVGVCIFTGLPSPELLPGMFGLPRNEQKGIFELSRLCLTPDIQSEEHNITSWFVSRCIKQLRKDTHVRAILSYADCTFHKGTIYAACNFTYYGLTQKKKDFWFLSDSGCYVKHSRGKVKGANGEWRDRSRKHRFVLTFDKNLNIKWVPEKWTSHITTTA